MQERGLAFRPCPARPQPADLVAMLVLAILVGLVGTGLGVAAAHVRLLGVAAARPAEDDPAPRRHAANETPSLQRDRVRPAARSWRSFRWRRWWSGAGLPAAARHGDRALGPAERLRRRVARRRLRPVSRTASAACCGGARAQPRSRATSATCARRRCARDENEEADELFADRVVAWYSLEAPTRLRAALRTAGCVEQHGREPRSTPPPPRPRSGSARSAAAAAATAATISAFAERPAAERGDRDDDDRERAERAAGDRDDARERVDVILGARDGRRVERCRARASRPRCRPRARRRARPTGAAQRRPRAAASRSRAAAPRAARRRGSRRGTPARPSRAPRPRPSPPAAAANDEQPARPREAAARAAGGRRAAARGAPRRRRAERPRRQSARPHTECARHLRRRTSLKR